MKKVINFNRQFFKNFVALVLLLNSYELFANVINLADIINNDNVNIYGSFECGMTNNRALYATSGYERQILTCTEAIIGINGNIFNNISLKNKTFFVLEFTPIYNSIKMDSYEQIKKYIYETIKSPATGKNIPIYSGSEYVNWYKNQGSRMYYLENYPIKEMYIGTSFFSDNLRFYLGRMKNLLSFNEKDMIWQEDAWFAPLAFWISKDLYTGIKIGTNLFNNLNLDVAIYSGDGNPTKSQAYYMNNVGSPSKKSNNTPTVTFQAKFDFDLSDKLNNSIFIGLERGTLGSTWTDVKKEGKHNKNIFVTGFETKYNINKININDFRLYFQYTRFISGLRERQTYVNSQLVKDITQRGIFAGFDINLKNTFIIGFTYEIFDRYDYMANVYSYGREKGKEPNKEDNLASLDWVSEIIPEKGSNRYKLTLNIKF